MNDTKTKGGWENPKTTAHNGHPKGSPFGLKPSGVHRKKRDKQNKHESTQRTPQRLTIRLEASGGPEDEEG